MEQPESSLPYSQAPATCPCPEPTPSSPHNPFQPSWRSILILFSHLRLGLPNGLLPSGFPTKTLCTPLPSCIRATCPAHLILDFITRTMLHPCIALLLTLIYLKDWSSRFCRNVYSYTCHTARRHRRSLCSCMFTAVGTQSLTKWTVPASSPLTADCRAFQINLQWHAHSKGYENWGRVKA